MPTLKRKTASGYDTISSSTPFRIPIELVDANLQSKAVTIDTNGTTAVTPDAGYDGLSNCSITTNVQPVTQSKSATYTENGTYSITPDSGYDGLSSASVTVNVSGSSVSEPYLEETISDGYRKSIKLHGYNNCHLFDNWDLRTINWNGCVPESIGSYAFYSSTMLSTINIPNGVTEIGDSAFYNCNSVTSLTIPNSVTTINYSAFYNLFRITSLTIPNSVTYLGGSAFYNCSSVTSLTISNSVTTIMAGCFYGLSALTSLTIPSSVTSIYTQGFGGLLKISTLTIPSTVDSIDSYAFQNLGKSNTGVIVRFNGTPTSLGNNAFNGSTTISDIYVPWASGAKTGAPWGATNATIHYNSST